MEDFLLQESELLKTFLDEKGMEYSLFEGYLVIKLRGHHKLFAMGMCFSEWLEKRKKEGKL